jgi:hypothetical protein
LGVTGPGCSADGSRASAGGSGGDCGSPAEPRDARRWQPAEVTDVKAAAIATARAAERTGQIAIEVMPLFSLAIGQRRAQPLAIV